MSFKDTWNWKRILVNDRIKVIGGKYEGKVGVVIERYPPYEKIVRRVKVRFDDWYETDHRCRVGVRIHVRHVQIIEYCKRHRILLIREKKKMEALMKEDGEKKKNVRVRTPKEDMSAGTTQREIVVRTPRGES